MLTGFKFMQLELSTADHVFVLLGTKNAFYILSLIYAFTEFAELVTLN